MYHFSSQLAFSTLCTDEIEEGKTGPIEAMEEEDENLLFQVPRTTATYAPSESQTVTDGNKSQSKPGGLEANVFSKQVYRQGQPYQLLQPGREEKDVWEAVGLWRE